MWIITYHFGNTASTTIETPSGQLHVAIREEFELRTVGAAVAVGWSKDSSSLAVASNYGGSLSVWDRGGHLVRQFDRIGGGPTSWGAIALTNNSTRLIFPPPADSPANAALAVWDVQTGKLVDYIYGAPRPGTANYYNTFEQFEVTRDEEKIVSLAGGGPPIIIVSDMREYKSNYVFSLDRYASRMCTFDEGNYLATVSMHGTVSIFNLKDGLLLKSFQVFEDPVNGILHMSNISVNKMGNTLFAGVDGLSWNGAGYRSTEAADAERNIGQAKIIGVDDGAVHASFKSADAPIRASAWDPKGRFVSFVDNAGGLFFWWNRSDRFDDYQRLSVERPNLSLAISPDGTLLAVATGRGVAVFSIK
jgi:WD40 repeat protein